MASRESHVSGCAQRSIGSDGVALQRGVLMPRRRSIGTWQWVVEQSNVVTGERHSSLEEVNCLSAVQETILGEPKHLSSFPFLHLLFSLFLAERFFVGCWLEDFSLHFIVMNISRITATLGTAMPCGSKLLAILW